MTTGSDDTTALCFYCCKGEHCVDSNEDCEHECHVDADDARNWRTAEEAEAALMAKVDQARGGASNDGDTCQ